MLADELQDHSILVDRMCAGWVSTDISGVNASRSISEGAAFVVWATTRDVNGPTPGFYRDGQPLAW